MKNENLKLKTLFAYCQKKIDVAIIALGATIVGPILFLPTLAMAQYNPLENHAQVFPQTKVMMIDYIGDGWNSPAKDPVILQFMATHYDAIIGGHDMTPYTANKPPQFMYVNYYCTYVGSSEYQDAQTWASSHGVDFESFFIHYASPTHACFGSACFDLPAGSRVPTYGWYGSGGDLTKNGSRVVFNVGNSNYRQWRLDNIAQSFSSKPFFDGVMIDNTAFTSVGVNTPATSSGGDFVEYPHSAGGNAGTDYGDDLVTLFSEFKTKFGSSKGQLPNVSSAGGGEPRIYPFVWGLFREMTLQPVKTAWLNGIYKGIAESEASGVKNLMGSVVFEDRHAIASLALYYLLKTNSTYFFPIQNNVADGYGIDPRINQWFGAVAYDIGHPVNDSPTQKKYFTFAAGIDPYSSQKITMNVQTVTGGGSYYQLVDPSQNWTDEQWRGKKIVFPSGLVMSVYHSGSNWISLWAPAEVPAVGTYQIGNYSYVVYGREFTNALVLFRPLGDSYKTDDSTASVEQLPVTANNPSGRYLILNKDGTINPIPVTTVTLRNTEGVILINASDVTDSVPPAAPTGLTIQ